MKIIEGNEFQKDLKKLLKKYKTLNDDLEVLRKPVCAEPIGSGGKHWNLVKQKGNLYILKTRMMCRAVKSATFRVVYLYDADKNLIVFIEIFFKGVKNLPDRERLRVAVERFME